MKRIGFFLLGGVFGLFAAEPKIGYIDSDRIFQEYRGAAEAKAKFQDEVSTYEAELRELQQGIETAQKSLETQRLMLSDEAQAAKEAELEALRERYESFVQEVWGAGGKLEAKNRELTLPLVQRINEVVQKVAEANHYTLVLDVAGGGIVYAQPEFDLTQLVIDELAKEYAPIALPTIPKKFAVLPLVERGPEARAAKLGGQCRQLIEAILEELAGKATWINRVDRARIDNALSARGVIEAPDAMLAKSVGREVGADYLITGAVEEKGELITVELTLVDLGLDRTYPTEQGKAQKEELLRETIAGLIQRFLQTIER
jgi:outer membrane protein